MSITTPHMKRDRLFAVASRLRANRFTRVAASTARQIRLRTMWWDPAAGEEDWPTGQGRAIRVSQQLWLWADDNGGPVALVKALLDRLPGARLTIYHFNTAITRIDLKPGRELHLRYFNRVPHLPQKLVS